jgi:hypothetical protein
MFANRSAFSSYKPVQDEVISVSGLHKLPVKGCGSVRFHTLINPNQTLDMTLTDILHIPNLGANLVSLGTLHRKGVQISSFDKGLTMSLNGNVLFYTKLIGTTETLYWVQCANTNANTAFLANG